MLSVMEINMWFFVWCVCVCVCVRVRVCVWFLLRIPVSTSVWKMYIVKQLFGILLQFFLMIIVSPNCK